MCNHPTTQQLHTKCTRRANFQVSCCSMYLQYKVRKWCVEARPQHASRYPVWVGVGAIEISNGWSRGYIDVFLPNMRLPDGVSTPLQPSHQDSRQRKTKICLQTVLTKTDYEFRSRSSYSETHWWKALQMFSLWLYCCLWWTSRRTCEENTRHSCKTFRQKTGGDDVSHMQWALRVLPWVCIAFDDSFASCC